MNINIIYTSSENNNNIENLSAFSKYQNIQNAILEFPSKKKI